MALNVVSNGNESVSIRSAYKLGSNFQTDNHLEGDVISVYAVEDGKVYVNAIRDDLFHGKFAFDLEAFTNIVVPNSEELESILSPHTNSVRNRVEQLAS